MVRRCGFVALLLAVFHVPSWGVVDTEAFDRPQVVHRYDAQVQVAMEADLEWRAFTGRYGDAWRVQWDGRTRVPHWIMGPGIPLGVVTAANVEDVCRRFLEEHSKLLRVDVADLELAFATHKAGRWFVTFDRYFEGVPVVDARVDLRIMSDGRLTLFGSSSHPEVDVDAYPSIGARAAQSAAAASMGLRSVASDDDASLVVLPLEDGDGVGYALVWEVDVTAAEPLGQWAHYVDAHTGAIVARWNRWRFGAVGGYTGGTIHPATPFDEPVYEDYRNQSVTVEGVGVVRSDFDGIWRATVDSDVDVDATLQGAWVRVFNDEGPEAALSTTAPLNQQTDLVWDDDNSVIEERDLYYHTEIAHQWVKDREEAFTWLDYAMRATCNISGSCNAFWDGSSINFYKEGGTCPDIAMIADVVYHEYGHGLTQFHNPRSNGSMHEGMSDYLGSTITNQPETGRGFFGPNTFLRTGENDRVYPAPECGGAVHCLGEATSGALWKSRVALIEALGEEEGTNLADSLWHWGKYGRANNELDYFVDYLLVDDDDGDLTNGTPHGEILFPPLAYHGMVQTLVSGAVFAFDAATPDIVADPGDEYSVVASYSMPLGAMGASSVEVTISCDSPHVSIVRGTVSYPDIAPGQTVDNGSEPFLLAIDEELTSVEDVEVRLELTSDPNFFDRTDVVTVRIGRSPVLLVDDDPEDDYSAYYTEPLEATGVVPNIWTVRTAMPLEFNKLNGFDSVIWYTGAAETATLDEDEQAEIAEYLDGGGNLMLSSQNLGADIGGTDFYGNYLKAEFVSDNSNLPLVEGTPGDVLTDGWLLLFTGQGGAPNGNSPDVVSATEEARDAMFYSGTSNGAAVVYEGAYRLFYLPFNFEGITGNPGNSREDVLRVILEWFGVPVGVHAVGLAGEVRPDGNWLDWRWVGDGTRSANIHRALGPDAAWTVVAQVSDASDYVDRDIEFSGTYRYRIGIVQDAGEEILSDEIDLRRGESPGLPVRHALLQNAPNPFNPSTSIGFALPEPAHVRLWVFDLAGRRVATLLDEHRKAGNHVVRWDGRSDDGAVLPSGVYLYRLEGGGFEATRRMVVVK